MKKYSLQIIVWMPVSFIVFLYMINKDMSLVLGEFAGEKVGLDFVGGASTLQDFSTSGYC